MPTLTIVMIVRNEAGRLADCLSSALPAADAFVIGDTGSTDGTPDVARRFGADVFEVPWAEDFAAARNAVLARATGDWLLHLDADEQLDPQAAARIRRLMAADAEGADAVEVTLANYCNEPRAWRWVPCRPGDAWTRGHSGYIPAPLLRLFRNGQGYEYREAVHENITESVLERGGRIREEPGILIHHYGYRPNDHTGPKARLYLRIARRKVEDRPGDPKAWQDLAEQALACGEEAEAESACRRALALAPGHLAAATTLASLLLNRGRLDAARAVLQTLEHDGRAAPHVVMALGAIAYRQGRLPEALDRLEAVLAGAPDHIMGRICLARVYDGLGRHEDAQRLLEDTLERVPGLGDVQDMLAARELRRQAAAAMDRRRPDQALRLLVQALQVDPEDPYTHNDLGVVTATLGDLARARACFHRALKLLPGHGDARRNLQSLEE